MLRSSVAQADNAFASCLFVAHAFAARDARARLAVLFTPRDPADARARGAAGAGFPLEPLAEWAA